MCSYRNCNKLQILITRLTGSALWIWCFISRFFRHLSAQDHDCDFDHKAKGKEILAKNNPNISIKGWAEFHRTLFVAELVPNVSGFRWENSPVSGLWTWIQFTSRPMNFLKKANSWVHEFHVVGAWELRLQYPPLWSLEVEMILHDLGCFFSLWHRESECLRLASFIFSRTPVRIHGRSPNEKMATEEAFPYHCYW